MSKSLNGGDGKQAKAGQAMRPEQRGQLSPELVEVLNMLKALEDRPPPKPADDGAR